MPPFALEFRVAFDGPLTDFARRHPSAQIALWCDWKREVVEVSGLAAEAVEDLRLALGERASWTEHHVVGGGTHVLVMDCANLPHDYVNHAVDAARCLNMPPTRFENGWERYKVVSFEDAQARDLFRALRDGGREVELLSKRALNVQPLLNTFGMGAPALLSDLTDRQLEAVLLAHRHGLYESPRRTTAATIADAVGLSRSTFEEHLRKAENRLMANLVPYVELEAKARAARAAGGAAPSTARASS